MAKTITPTTTDEGYRIAAENGAALLAKAFDAAVNLPMWAIGRVVENWDLGDANMADGDYVSAWLAYGAGYLAIVDNQEFSLLKRNQHGEIV